MGINRCVGSFMPMTSDNLISVFQGMWILRNHVFSSKDRILFSSSSSRPSLTRFSWNKRRRVRHGWSEIYTIFFFYFGQPNVEYTHSLKSLFKISVKSLFWWFNVMGIFLVQTTLSIVCPYKNWKRSANSWHHGTKTQMATDRIY